MFIRSWLNWKPGGRALALFYVSTMYNNSFLSVEAFGTCSITMGKHAVTRIGGWNLRRYLLFLGLDFLYYFFRLKLSGTHLSEYTM
jgi:hypothetical protein